MARPSVAVVGGGIAGITAALGLQDLADTVLFDAGPELGGHILPVPVPAPHGETAHVDAGFVVFVPETYPVFTRMLDALGLEHARAATPFRITDDLRGLSFPAAELLERCGRELPRSGRKELLRLYHALIRVRREGLGWVENVSLQAWMDGQGFSVSTAELGVLPWVASFWGLQPETARRVSAKVALREIARNAGPGGMHRVVPSTRGYLDALVDGLSATDVRLQRVQALTLQPRPMVTTEVGQTGFDHVVLAVEAEVAAALLETADPTAHAVLSRFEYEPTAAVVHRDAALLPPDGAQWTTFHHHRRRDADRVRSTTTWWFDALHEWSPRADVPTLLTTGDIALADGAAIDPDTVLARFRHRHLVSTPEVVAALTLLDGLAHERPYSLAGSYLGLGALHEDAVCSGMRAARDAAAQLGLADPRWAWSGTAG
jgi:predicted NAD/FAD-binding protein